MKSQPIPRIKLEGVERVVRRDYSETQFDSVMAVLSGYESKRDRSRVLLATLKLANGNLNALRKHIGTALQDFRDVLTPAEYPEYWRRRSSGLEMAGKERDRIIDSAWEQYEVWLKR
jgi:hypothetical protein